MRAEQGQTVVHIECFLLHCITFSLSFALVSHSHGRQLKKHLISIQLQRYIEELMFYLHLRIGLIYGQKEQQKKDKVCRDVCQKTFKELEREYQ